VKSTKPFESDLMVGVWHTKHGETSVKSRAKKIMLKFRSWFLKSHDVRRFVMETFE
jgi:hypothetical protein